MPIAGLIVTTETGRAEEVLGTLDAHDGVTTYGVHKEDHVVAVVEADSLEALDASCQELADLPGVVSVAPTYVNFEEAEKG